MRRALLLLVLTALLPAGLAWSAPWIAPVAAPALVREGADYETVVPTLPAGIDEFELFLLIEDGPRRLVRLAPEREGRGGTVRWRMPRVGASRGRLVLRAGGRLSESESAPSEPFEIVRERQPRRAEVLRAREQIEDLFGEPVAAAPAWLPPGHSTLEPASPPLAAVAPQRAGNLPAPAPAPREACAAPAAADPAPPAPDPDRRPASVPLRN